MLATSVSGFCAFYAFSVLPLRLITLFGLLFGICGLLFATWVVISKTLNPEAILPGYASLVILLSLGFGAVLFALGVVSEYLFRVNEKTSKRPVYKVRNEC